MNKKTKHVLCNSFIFDFHADQYIMTIVFFKRVDKYI